LEQSPRRDAVPKIDDNLLRSVVYLYPAEQDARSGKGVGGTGFLVGIKSRRGGIHHLYVATNRHVVREGRSSVVRYNSLSGELDVIAATPAQWVDHEAGDDLSVLPISPGWAQDHNLSFVPGHMFIPERMENPYGPGDETFMIGRFVNHEGREENLPSVRFGNISMVPWEMVRTASGLLQEAYLVESRSHSGYSGSPVFAHRPHLIGKPSRTPLYMGDMPGPWLLGIDSGHLPLYRPVVDKDRSPIEGQYVEVNSGQSVVIPAWRLTELLNQPELTAARAPLDEAVERLRRSRETKPDASGPSQA
jgi:hypothetical protein